MKIVLRWLKLTLGTVALVMLTSCGTTTYIPTESTVGNMSVKEARQRLADLPRYRVVLADGSECSITGARVTSTKLVVSNTCGKNRILKFGELGLISQNLTRKFVNDTGDISISHEIVFITDFNTLDRYSLTNTLYILQQNAVKAKKEYEIYDANFATSLNDYRNKTASSTALPEDANRFKVQAEGAVRDKDFVTAQDFYAKALKIAPWWSVGHFNRALVLGETGDYEMAIREMKMYLQLVPDAPNARAAQDKIYDWERLDSK